MAPHENWTSGPSPDERQIIRACLCHSLLDTDAPSLDHLTDLAETLLDQLDDCLRHGELADTDFVAKVPEPDRRAVWASMWAGVGRFASRRGIA